MFEQLRIKVAIRQSLTMGVMLVIILMMIFSYNATRLSATIDENLAELSSSKYVYFFGDEGGNKVISDKYRDNLAIWIDTKNNVFLSDIAFYEEDTVKQLLDTALSKKTANGRATINGNFMAYSVQESFLGTFIYVYDYTKDFENLRNMTVMIIIAGAVGIVAITLVSFRFAKNSVAPIEDAFNKQQDLVANASHELKTPITIINADLEILNATRDTMSEEQVKWLDSINSQLSRMSRLVTEMLELARIEGNRDKTPAETVNLSTVAESVVLEAEVLAFEHSINFETEIENGVEIQGVTAHIEKLIYILVENALKYTPHGGTVKVSVSGERKKAILKVRNTGEGIEREKLPKLFDRFYRTDESHTGTESNSFGLGLAIAKSIVDSHGGTIGVDSVEGEFTEFVVIFKGNN